jgi:predicted NAD-dependent protein-ADP-ribosyltransferase YbiA (DUF1768 family)
VARVRDQQTTLEDGTVLITKANGQRVELRPSGDKVISSPDGSRVTFRADGFVVHGSANGEETVTPPKLRYAPHEKPLNVASMSAEEIGRLMSNFAETPFVLDDERYASVEGFYVSVLTQDEDLRARLRLLSGREAKSEGRKLERTRGWYDGREITLGSTEHVALIKRAIAAKLAQNPHIAEAFRATHPRPIVHDTGRPERVGSLFPARVFVWLLTELRDALVAAEI